MRVGGCMPLVAADGCRQYHAGQDLMLDLHMRQLWQNARLT